MKSDPTTWEQIIGEAPAAAAPFDGAPEAFTAPRHLMSMLRDIMAAADSPEKKLSRIVSILSRDLGGDACACFVMRGGKVLELMASEGLTAEARKGLRVQPGVGGIGAVASLSAPLVIPDLVSHPKYGATAETNGGKLRGFCGVPILRGGRVRGVLALMNARPRVFGAEVVEIMQTVAMLVAELVVAGGLASRLEIGAAARGPRTAHIDGISLGRGVSIGTAVLYDAGVDMQDVAAEDPALQKQRLHQALASMHAAIDDMLTRNAALSGTESRDILEAYQMFARDRGWLARIETIIDRGLCAEAAVQRVQNETRSRMLQMTDAYIRERLSDLEDLSNRLLSHLVRQDRAALHAELPENMILVARSLGPAALLDYDREVLKGVVLEKGSQADHVAIVARALNMPVAGQCAAACSVISDGDQIIVDGDQGRIYVNPPEHILDLYVHSIEARARRANLHRGHAQRVCATKDGVKVSVMVNAGMLAEAGAVHAVSADGIGLFRTELSFMGWKKYPLVATQAELYGKVLDQADGKPVVFRTFDIGGDKPLPYFESPAEEDNPALGWRAVRIGVDRPSVLRTQFRAFIRAADGRELRIMLPFVSEVAEVDKARLLLDMELHRADKAPSRVELGVMIEIPSLLWQMDALLAGVDFVSVGTNDLMQYLFAADRCNHAIRNRYDTLSPPMLSALKFIADKCRAAGKPLSVCGEMAGQPLEAMVLVALGYDTLSVPAQAVEAVRASVPCVDTRVLEPFLARLVASRGHSVRERLMSFARDHDIPVAA